MQPVKPNTGYPIKMHNISNIPGDSRMLATLITLSRAAGIRSLPPGPGGNPYQVLPIHFKGKVIYTCGFCLIWGGKVKIIS